MKNTQTKTKQAAEEIRPGKTPDAQVVSLSAETVEALADVIAERFVNALPLLLGAQTKRLESFLLLHSRLCASDTVRTTERPGTVFRHAIKEAEIARQEIERNLQATNA